MPRVATGDDEPVPMIEAGAPKSLSIPGSNSLAYVMLPLRLVIWAVPMLLLYPIMLVMCWLRAVYLRLVIGRPSQILKLGTYGNKHMADLHYASHVLYSQPFEQERLRKALVELCAEDGIKEAQIELLFSDEVPNSWPATGSWHMSHFIPKAIPYGSNHFSYWLTKHSKYMLRIHVFNGAPGEPTVMLYAGSGNAWDGSSNYNFVKELNNRYMGNKETVFVKPAITTAAAAKADAGSFVWFLLKQPINLWRGLSGAIWNAIRNAKWAGGNGLGFKITALNFTESESKALYNGASAQGASVFACYTYAAHKATKEIVGHSFTRMVQQASLQTRHFPVAAQGASRDFVGDWLVGPVAYVENDYTLEKAQLGYKELTKDLDEFGPRTQRSFMAKAYGLFNSGAAAFEVFPMYNDDVYVFDKCLFMNNYGVRSNPNPAWEAWNWNAPFWLGVNTINVNGKTTTLVGSCMWGMPVVEAIRDRMEVELRAIMAKAPAGSAKEIPTHKPPTL